MYGLNPQKGKDMGDGGGGVSLSSHFSLSLIADYGSERFLKSDRSSKPLPTQAKMKTAAFLASRQLPWFVFQLIKHRCMKGH